MHRLYVLSGLIFIGSCIEQAPAPIEAVDLDGLVGKRFALVDFSYSGISGGYGSPEVFVVGLRKMILINEVGDEIQASVYPLEGNTVDTIASPESRITIHEDGREISYQNQRFTQFSDIADNDLSLADSRWKLTLPANVAAACPGIVGAPTTTITLSRESGNVLLIQTTQRSVGCYSHTMNFGQHPISNESIRRISADRKLLWLKEGIYRRVN